MHLPHTDRSKIPPKATSLALAAAVLALATAPFPADAQIGGRLRDPAAILRGLDAGPTTELLQLTGKWETSVGTIEIVGGGPGRASNRAMVFGSLTTAQGQEISFGIWASNGVLKGQGFETNFDGLRNFEASVQGDTLEFRFLNGSNYQGRQVIAGTRTGAASLAASPFAGRWSTSLGELDLRAEGNHLTGTLVPKGGGSNERRMVVLHPFERGQAIQGLGGAWRFDMRGVGGSGALRIDLTSDGQRFLGTYSTIADGAETERAWSGQRTSGTTQPPASQPQGPQPQPPVSQPQPMPPGGPNGSPSTPPRPQPTTPPGDTAGGAAFKPLRRVDVRFDRLWVARGYPTHQVHAFLTVRNSSATPQHFTSGFMKVVLADADGAGWERSQPYRASGEPAALFNATPVIQPGGELKVRYVFTPEEDSQLSTLTVSEGTTRAEFPVGSF